WCCRTASLLVLPHRISPGAAARHLSWCCRTASLLVLPHGIAGGLRCPGELRLLLRVAGALPGLGVLPLELRHPTGGVEHPLLAGVEGVADVAGLDVKLAAGPRAPRHKGVAT